MVQLAVVLEERLRAAFARAGIPGQFGAVRASDRPDLADFQCNDCMAAAKAMGKPPREVAQSVVAAYQAIDPVGAAQIEIAGPGFLNLVVGPGALNARMEALSADPQAGLFTRPAPRRVVIDFCGPNVAKAMHVGHLRSTIIGDSLQRLFRACGDHVTSDIHMGDWGLQMGQLIAGLAAEQPDLPFFADGDGPFPAQSPVTLEDLERLYPLASAQSKADPQFRETARRATAQLQAGRPGYRALWRHFVAVTRASLTRELAVLDVHFDLWKGESDVDSIIAGMVDDLTARGLAERDAGALIVRVAEPTDKKDIAPLILLSSEGSALYHTTDLATILDRRQSLDPDLFLYVVDQRQAEHFEQVFRAAAQAGYAPRDALEHIGFGTMNGPDGKPFKTRAGGVIKLADLIDSARDAARARLDQAGYGGELTAEDRDDVVEKVAIAAIKFADLINPRLSNYIFDLDKFVSFEGKTGPYLLYAAVRMNGVLRKAADNSIAPGAIALDHPAERKLALCLDAFTLATQQAYDKRAPHGLADHAFSLAQAFSSFWAACPILQETDSNRRSSRLALTALAARQLQIALDILGIAVPARM
ncbi:MAG TPA: arginine--tRNA ligase [Hyphomonadaceae bacterium]|nr:arginine--tRNA ligase [Hyphomonadaceae bacterium]